MSIVNGSLQVARLTTAQIAASSTVPLAGQLVFNSQTGQYKIGDAVTALSALTYYGGTSTTYTGTANRVTVTGSVIDISSTFEALLGKVASPLSQFAVTTSAQLAGVISDETGSGALVFGTSPTFTTNINPSTALVIGNASAAGGSLSQLRVGLGTSFIDIGEASSGFATIWMNQAMPTTTTYSIRQKAGDLAINADLTGGSITLNYAGTSSYTLKKDTFTASCVLRSGGNNTSYTFNIPSDTSSTASANIPKFKVVGNTTQWASGTIALQYFNWFTSNTISFSGASTATLTANAVFEYVQGGTNSTITTSAAIYVPTLALTNTGTSYGLLSTAASGATTNWAIGSNGDLKIFSGFKLQLGNAATTGLGAGLLASTTNATIVITDSTGQAYRIPCII